MKISVKDIRFVIKTFKFLSMAGRLTIKYYNKLIASLFLIRSMNFILQKRVNYSLNFVKSLLVVEILAVRHAVHKHLIYLKFLAHLLH